jgi:hypothetical protein
VFDYKFAKFPEVHNFNYWAILLWDRLIMIMMFHDPACDCESCTVTLRDTRAGEFETA